jgi:hypothetical protein
MNGDTTSLLFANTSHVAVVGGLNAEVERRRTRQKLWLSNWRLLEKAGILTVVLAQGKPMPSKRQPPVRELG